MRSYSHCCAPDRAPARQAPLPRNVARDASRNYVTLRAVRPMAQPTTYSASVVASPAVPWYRTVSAAQWRVLLAAKLGWALDAFDFMLYAMAIGQLRAYFGINDATAGLLGTVTLAMSAVG